ncbi:MAG: Hint domain-containing protein, partial [bacterium]
YVDATPDHLFMLRDGSFREAGDLVKEDFIMSNTFQEINEIEIRLDVKVVRVEQLDIIEDAYDLGVENESHVFALDAGIFVHNSIPGGMNNTSLTKLDIRYARTIKRIQSVLKNGIRDMCNYWLFINDKKDKIDKFKVKMTKITSSEDAEKSEEMESLIRLADSIHNLVGRDYEDLLNKREFLIWLSNDIMKIEGMEKVIKSKEEWEKEQEESDDDDGDDRGGFGGF